MNEPTCKVCGLSMLLSSAGSGWENYYCPEDNIVEIVEWEEE